MRSKNLLIRIFQMLLGSIEIKCGKAFERLIDQQATISRIEDDLHGHRVNIHFLLHRNHLAFQKQTARATMPPGH